MKKIRERIDVRVKEIQFPLDITSYYSKSTGFYCNKFYVGDFCHTTLSCDTALPNSSYKKRFAEAVIKSEKLAWVNLYLAHYSLPRKLFILAKDKYQSFQKWLNEPVDLKGKKIEPAMVKTFINILMPI